VTKRHDSASGSRARPEEPLGTAQARTQGVHVHEVRERELPVDLDRRKELAVARLELGPAIDVDELELEAELSLQLVNGLERLRAEAAVDRVVDGDPRYGYKPRVVVASATRCTAMP
jgi:hypothetical protein